MIIVAVASFEDFSVLLLNNGLQVVRAAETVTITAAKHIITDYFF